MDRRRLALTGLLVFAAAFAAHARSLGAGFVYDDHRFVEENRAIESLGEPWRFFSDPRTASAEAGVEIDVYRPLRTLHFALDRALFGLAPFGWHLGNVLLHGLTSVLVWVLLLRVLAPRAPGGAGVVASTVGALLFAVHPVGSEAVAWVSSRGDLLALLLLLLALEVARRPGAARTAGAVALVGLACLAKESAVVAFALLPLRDAALPASVRPPRATTWGRAAAFLVVAALYLWARARVIGGAGGLPLAQLDVAGSERLAVARTMLGAVAWYARALVFPVGFPLEHDLPVAVSFGEPAVVVGGALVLTALLAGVRALVRGNGPLALACLGPLVCLVPVSNVVVPLKAFVAERFLYPALPFLALLPALGLARLLSRPPAWLPRLAGATAALVVLALGGLAFAREAHWRDDRALWTAVQREDPTNFRSYEGIGFEWFEESLRRARAGDLEGAAEARRRAEVAYRTYLESAPDDGKALTTLGDLYGRVAEALEARSGVEREVLEDREVVTRTGTEGARYARLRQLEQYQRAISVWERVGLARGRGWPALLRDTARRLRDVALRLGDLASARLANDLLVREDRRSGTGPRYEQRRADLEILLYAVRERPPTPRAPPPALVLERARLRAELLRAAGLDPNRADSEVRVALLPRMSELLAERGDDPPLRRARAAALVVRASRGGSEREADLRAALEDLRWLASFDPADSAAAARLEQVRALLGEPR